MAFIEKLYLFNLQLQTVTYINYRVGYISQTAAVGLVVQGASSQTLILVTVITEAWASSRTPQARVRLMAQHQVRRSKPQV